MTKAQPDRLEIPEDLLWALDADAQASAQFNRLPPSHRREYITWIESARKPETRARRLQQAIDMITASKR